MERIILYGTIKRMMDDQDYYFGKILEDSKFVGGNQVLDSYFRTTGSIRVTIDDIINAEIERLKVK